MISIIQHYIVPVEKQTGSIHKTITLSRYFIYLFISVILLERRDQNPVMKIHCENSLISSTSSISTSFRKIILGCSFLALSLISEGESFTIIPSHHHHRHQQHYRQRQRQKQQQAREIMPSPVLTTATRSSTSSSSSSSLSMAAISSSPQVEISTPSQSKCETLGIREWPQQSKKGSWTECTTTTSDDDDGEDSSPSLVRYVLEGTGTLKINDKDETKNNRIVIKPGMLVEIGGNNVELEWTCDDDCQEMIVLTPNFEEGNIFIGVIGAIIILFGLLLSGAVG
jgi:hypothetical protein